MTSIATQSEGIAPMQHVKLPPSVTVVRRSEEEQQKEDQQNVTGTTTVAPVPNIQYVAVPVATAPAIQYAVQQPTYGFAAYPAAFGTPIQVPSFAQAPSSYQLVLTIDNTSELTKYTEVLNNLEEARQALAAHRAHEAAEKSKAEAARKVKEEADRKAKEEADRKAKEDADKKAKAEADRQAKEAADKKAKEEAEKAKAAAQQKAEEQKKEEKIQEKIRDMGMCSAGYAWKKEATGYRCQGGGHFLSNQELGITA
ncbi:hypothetical protein K474DRAFT_1701948 [Panus rudis PR-1116 ss-1]|nr:hypothetical protein K474DRAFT_1701948 [Panus rudis PR-1116 ss-1]